VRFIRISRQVNDLTCELSELFLKSEESSNARFEEEKNPAGFFDGRMSVYASLLKLGV
jgi:hypothetical protein